MGVLPGGCENQLASAAAISHVLSAKSVSVGDSLLEYGSSRIHQTTHPEIARPGGWGQIGDSESTLLFPVAHLMHQSVVLETPGSLGGRAGNKHTKNWVNSEVFGLACWWEKPPRSRQFGSVVGWNGLVLASAG